MYTFRSAASYGGDHQAIQVDVSDSASVTLLFKKLKSSFPDKKTTCVVNSAGIVERPTPIATMSDAVFDKTISTNLRVSRNEPITNTHKRKGGPKAPRFLKLPCGNFPVKHSGEPITSMCSK